MEVRAGAQSTTLEAGTTEDCCVLPYSQAELQLTNFYTAQGQLPRDCAAHSGLGSPTLIINQDKSSGPPKEEKHTVTPSSDDSRLHQGDNARKDSV